MGRKKKASTYGEKLKDARWIAARNATIERDGNACTRCGVTGATLHVHHTYYEMGVEPWDYPPTSLITVCVPCHEIEDAFRVELRALIGCVPPSIRARIHGYVYGQYKLAFYEMGNADEVLKLTGDLDFLKGVADACGIGPHWKAFAVTAKVFEPEPMKVSDALEMRDWLIKSIHDGADDGTEET